MKKVLYIVISVVYVYAQTWNVMNKMSDARADDIAIGYKYEGGEQFQYIYSADVGSWPYLSINEGVWDSLIGQLSHEDSRQPMAIITDSAAPAHVYIARKGFGVYYSDFYGKNWKRRWDPSQNPGVWKLAMVLGNPAYVYAGCTYSPTHPHTLYYTTDFGMTWHPVVGVPNESVYGISIFNENIIYVIIGNNLYKYNGINWENIFTGCELGKVKVDPHNSQRVFVSMPTILWRSLDGGQSWEPVFYSYPYYISTIEIGRTGWVYVGVCNKGIFRSQDGSSNSFEDITKNIHDRSILTIKVDPLNSDKIYVGTVFNVYKSACGTKPKEVVIWEEFNEGMRKTYPEHFSTSLPEAIYASAKGGIYVTTDMGETWKVAGGWSFFVDGHYIEQEIDDIIVDPFNFEKVYVTHTIPWMVSQISRTTNGGLTWEEGVWFDPPSIVANFAIYFQNPLNIFLTRGNPPHLLKSTDGGNYWNEINIEDSLGGLVNPISIALDPQDSQTIYIGCDWQAPNAIHGVIKSTNGGYNWSQTGLQDRTVYSLDINQRNPNILYAGTDNQIWRTKDGGNTWEYIPVIPFPPPSPSYPPKVHALKLDPEEPSIIYTDLSVHPYQRSDFYISPDAGRSWKIYSEGLPDTLIRDIQIDNDFPDSIFLLTENKGLYWTKTTWEKDQLTTSSPFATAYNNGRKIAYSVPENTIWAVYKSGDGDYSDNGGIFITSSNDGDTWTPKLELAGGYGPVIDINPDGDPYVIFSKKNEFGNNGLYGIGRILPNNTWPSEPIVIIPPGDYNPVIHYSSFKIRDDGMGFFSVITCFHRELIVGYFNTTILNPEIHFLPSPYWGCDLWWQSLTLLGDGRPAVAYFLFNTPRPIIFQYFKDNEWSKKEIVISGLSEVPHHFLDLTPEGNPCVVWESDGKIYFRERKFLIHHNGEILWGGPIIKLSDDDKVAAHPQIARYGSLLLVLWEQKTIDGRYEIAYRVYTPLGGWEPVEIIDSGNEISGFPNAVIRRGVSGEEIYFLFTKEVIPVYECKFRKRIYIPHTFYLNFSFLSPSINEETPISKEIPIEWVICGYDIFKVNLYLSEDGGQTFNFVFQNISPGEKIWDIPEVYKGKYKFLNVDYPTKKLAYKIEVFDSLGNKIDTVIPFSAMPYSSLMNITEGNNQKKIASDLEGNIYVIYTSSLIDSSMYDTSGSLRFGKEVRSKVYYIKTKDGEKFSSPQFLGYGIEPSMDIYNSPYFVFLSEDRDTIYLFKNDEKTVFSVSETDFSFYSPSIKIDNSGIHLAVEKMSDFPLNDSTKVEVIYFYTPSFGEEPFYETIDEWNEKFIKKPGVPVETTVVETLKVEPLIVDTQKVFKVSQSGSPSISVDYKGNVHIVYEKKGEIFYALKDSIWNKQRISHQGVYAWHPSIDIYGINVGITWSEKDTLKGGWTVYRKYGVNMEFLKEDTLADYANGTSYIRKNAGVVWDKDKEIVYRRYNPLIDDFESEKIIFFSLGFAKYPQFETYWNEYNSYDYFIWTDPEIVVTPVIPETVVAIPVIIKPVISPYFFLDFKAIPRDLKMIPPYINISLGKETPSDFTLHRDGYREYLSGISVDYANQQLLYKFPKIFSEKLRFLFEIYYEDIQDSTRKVNIKITGDGIAPPVSEDVVYESGETKNVFLSANANTTEGIIMVHLNKKEGEEVTLKRISIASLKDMSAGGGIMGLKNKSLKGGVYFVILRIENNLNVKKFIFMK